MLNLDLSQHQRNELHLTAQLQQAISLLQLSSQELSDYLEKKAAENPLIELKIESSNEYKVKRLSQSSLQDERVVDYFDYIADKKESLKEHLKKQARVLPLPQKECSQLVYFIEHLDNNGYLRETLTQLSDDLNMTEHEAEHILIMLQSLEPVGVGARSLKECLLLQLKRLNPRYELAEYIVEDDLELLAHRRWRELAQKYQMDLKSIEKVHDFIQNYLQPKPGANFDEDETKYIIPDVTIEVDKLTKTVQVNIHRDHLPRLAVNDHYVALLKNNDLQNSQYLKEKLDEIVWLQRSLRNRESTLKKVCHYIVQHQQSFFFQASAGLKPMILKQIAEELNIHESTVSRVTTNKYVQTPRGMMELKSFFTHAVNRTQSMEQISSLQLKQWIKKMVEQENKRKPISDQRIVQALNETYGVTISRRAIAKYRAELKILPSFKRKSYS
ncbi:putative RNA polymerase [Bacillus sp. TS-2]|nr:putative RNA polymerase [Bacillus sp. TS-2]